ncbi:MAG TPA: SagB/ThcOx family dehydrogenase [Gaiellaceae bacterium]|nr:SagB/ThcOx family dehydrogenase [Gaiellaceae bacterium]
MSVRRQTARWLEVVYGGSPVADDPAEAYHEASKLDPSQIARQLEGTRRLAASPHLLLSSSRAVKRHGRPRVALPPPAELSPPLGEVITSRRSERAFDRRPIPGAALAALLHAGYGVTGLLPPEDDRPALPLRAVPSGGALYPLELYPAVLRVGNVKRGLYHFDPLSPGLELLRSGLREEELAALSTYPEVASSCAALVLVAAIFGRTRFKYGLRGYRFALLEAGHVAQNLALAATALGLAAVPLGALYDRRTDAFVGLDGVNESTVYAVAVGRIA